MVRVTASMAPGGDYNPPQAFYNIGPTYFKSPPGWAKGKKTGWEGQPLPPGR